MILSAKHRLKFAVFGQQLWRLQMSEELESEMKNSKRKKKTTKIYLPHFTNNLSKKILVFASNCHKKMFESRWMREKWNFRAGCI